ncbi:ty1-copia retrotransposon protein [Cucumis melo var. makuwa]|uniref:Ty1-copia retrotransposon protein n=1 Tax=Cucumis melo var. makuwa TaxID=1194695 RepID=A0A5D3CA78_CUCMM|nr:ty1-copia retrotransposon protein [Cucumis melo var. makuwa]TYK07226.1 ty1-copia retrotransposon protein [Cucumis melo var. makuwa]
MRVHGKLSRTLKEMMNAIQNFLRTLKRTCTKSFRLEGLGCLTKVPFPALKKSTVGSKTFDCIFIGYAQNNAAYSLSKRMHGSENPSIVSETSVSETVNTSNLRCELELRRSKRQRTEKSFGPDFLSTFIVERRDEIDCNFTNLYLIDEDPKTYQEVLNSIESSMWKVAIKSELDSFTGHESYMGPSGPSYGKQAN